MKRAVAKTAIIIGGALVLKNLEEWYEDKDELLEDVKYIASKSKKILIASGIFYLAYKI